MMSRFPSRRLTTLPALAMALTIANGGFTVGPVPGAGAGRSAARPQAASGVPSLAEPSLSPDRSEIAFESGGDIWTVSSQGGVAHLLVSDPAFDHRPLYSPDGTRLAFVSTRTGNGDIYILDLRTSAVTRLTYDDGSDQLDAWSRDGRWIYFSSSSQDIAGMNDVLRVPAAGGTPMIVAGDRYASEFWSAPSPDGQTVAIAARGNAVSQWWRHGHSHLDISELYVVRPGDPPSYTRVSDGTEDAKEMWPMWSPDGHALYYVSDRGGSENLWTRPLGGAAERLTSFGDGRVLWPQASLDGRAIVFERDFGVWLYDTSTRQAHAVAISLRGAPSMPSVEHLALTSGFRDLALSPDGRKVAFVARGDVFAAPSRDAGAAARVTSTPGPEQGVAWLPDSRRIVYASSRDGTWRIYLYDFASRAESLLTPDGDAIQPTISPDGKWLAYSRNAHELHLMELATRADHRAATGQFDRPPFVGSDAYAFSPDSRWLAFISTEPRGFENAFVVPVAGGEPRQVSFLANSSGNAVDWSPDGTFLLVLSNQRTESPQLARVDLVPRAPAFHEDAFRALFPGDSSGGRRPAAPAGAPRDSARAPRTPPRTEIDFADIRRRASLLPTRVDVQRMRISPDGKQLLLTGSAAGQTNLWLLSLDELAPPAQAFRQLTTSSGGEQGAQWSADGKEIWYLEGGRIQAMNAESRQVRPLAVTAELDVDFDTEKIEVFRQAWSFLRDNFFDGTMHGADWNAVGARTERQVAGARSPDEMRRILSLMIGELNASHLGIGGGGGGTAPAVGKLGAGFSRSEYERSGRLRFEDIIPEGPVARDVKAGEFLLAVDSTTLTPSSNLDDVMSHSVGRRVTLRIGAADGSATRDVVVRPVSTGAEKGLRYRAWVEERRAYVARVSGGRLGYVHMLDMGAGSLAQLLVDLDDENQSKEGLVIDIRNNNGGFVNSYALDVFSRRPFMTMTPRGRQEFPARQQLGQRVFDRPTVLVVNQHSLSDAEDFTEGYRTLGLGPVVGEPTAGWIIYTSNVSLLDGTTVRLPSTRIRDHEGKDMELHPRPVDIRVDRPVGESYTGTDSQLDAAVKALIARLPKR